MRTNDKGEIIITRRKAAEIFLLLSNARLKLKGKMRTSAEKYWREFEDILVIKMLEKDTPKCREAPQ